MNKPVLLLVLTACIGLVFSSCKKDEEITKSGKKIIKKNAVSFEEITLNEDGYFNGSDGSGGFTSGNAIFKTNYNYEYGSWSGFAVSNHTDTITTGFTNQYSSVTGSGAGKSKQYVVLYSYSADTIEFVIPAKITNIALTNSTYAYYSMKNGDNLSKKFGGQSGNDPDYFYLYLSVIDSAGNKGNFNPIPLADFTSNDNSLDYILKEWNYYDLSPAGYIKYLIFRLASSDTSASGINTPT
jgi:hypothetical protein